MPPKQKKIVLWTACDLCGVEIPFKDKKIHSESCSTVTTSWKVPFISESKFHTELDFDTTGSVNIECKGSSIVLHQSVIQLCGFVIGEYVKVEFYDQTINPVVKRVWPHNETTHLCSGFSCEDSSNENKIPRNSKIIISKFRDEVLLVTSIHFSMENCVDTGELVSFLKLCKRDEIFSLSSDMFVCYFGKRIRLNPNTINNKKCSEISKLQWFMCNENTDWLWQNDLEIGMDDRAKDFCSMDGASDVISEIFTNMNAVFRSSPPSTNFKFHKTVLLYGHSGTGKTTVAKFVAAQSQANVVNINTSEIYSKYYGETETALKKLFHTAITTSPSVILIDDLDVLCPKRTTAAAEQEKRITSTLAALLDNIHDTGIKVFVICCSSKIDIIDPSLRRYGRIDQEIEIPIPDQSKRHVMLKSLLSSVSHDLTELQIKSLSDAAHGYVAADIANLCTQACMDMLRNPSHGTALKLDNFTWALNHVSPSAMREALVDIPNVKWTDIGGEDDLKLKLKQLVEWPLKYGESFTRLGIKPPSGILMYGPPGCSKTMIAKAVASESHLNFLSIKGPELFSKWVGESERAVRELFRKARQVAPSIIFFDEIDALGSERSNNSSSNVQERLLAQLLTEMDGITPLGNVTIIAATNRPDKIDSALLRPGRLDRIVYVPLPSECTRLAIFELRLSKMAVDKSVDIKQLVALSEGYSGAEIIAVCHEAALKALEEDINIREVSLHHFNEAFCIVKPRTPEYLLNLYCEFGRKL